MKYNKPTYVHSIRIEQDVEPIDCFKNGSRICFHHEINSRMRIGFGELVWRDRHGSATHELSNS